MLHPTASHIFVKHTPKQDKGKPICPLIQMETINMEGEELNPSPHDTIIEHTKTKMQESEQVASERDTNTRHKKHGGERRAWNLHHPNASHQISVNLTPKQDKGGSICQLINIETNSTEGVELNPSLHGKIIEHTETRLQEIEQTVFESNTSTRQQKHGGERRARPLPHSTASHQIVAKHTGPRRRERLDEIEKKGQSPSPHMYRTHNHSIDNTQRGNPSPSTPSKAPIGTRETSPPHTGWQAPSGIGREALVCGTKTARGGCQMLPHLLVVGARNSHDPDPAGFRYGG
jgi:hypothetical protein